MMDKKLTAAIKALTTEVQELNETLALEAWKARILAEMDEYENRLLTTRKPGAASVNTPPGKKVVILNSQKGR